MCNENMLNFRREWKSCFCKGLSCCGCDDREVNILVWNTSKSAFR